MFKKIFVDVFFEKKRILVSFISIFIAMLFFTGIQTVVMVSQSSKLLTKPDVQMVGSGRSDGLIDFKLYSNITGLSKKISELSNGEMRVYGTTCRNLETVQDVKTLETIYYWIYGVNNSFFDTELGNCLKEGRMPSKNVKEAVIGSYAARHYKLNINDKINVPVTLNSDANEDDISQYTIVGILDDNIDYYKGSILISKESFMTLNPKAEIDDNLLLIYFKNSNSVKKYTKIINANKDFISTYHISGVNTYYIEKNSLKMNLIMSYILVLSVGAIVLFLLMSYIFKGITKKIGLLKALGISDIYITKVFIGGIGITLTFSFVVAMLGILAGSSYLNYNLSRFYGFKVKIYTVHSSIYLVLIIVTLIIFIVTYFITKIKSSRISPRDAMLKL